MSKEGYSYSIATANVLDKPTVPQAYLGGVNYHKEVVKRSGYDALELWPMQPWITLQVWIGKLQKNDPLIASMHQSPRGEKLTSVRSPQQMAIVTLLPTLPASLSFLERVREQVSDIPAVLYQETSPVFHKETEISHRLLQPDPEVCKDWGVTSPEDFINKLQTLGQFTGICLDTNHFRRNAKGNKDYENPLKDWRKTLPVFVKSGMLEEVHLAVGRTDLPAISREETIAELKDLMDDTEESEIKPILRELRDLGWTGRIVLETLPTAILAVRGEKGLLSTGKQISAYQDIRNTLEKLFQ